MKPVIIIMILFTACISCQQESHKERLVRAAVDVCAEDTTAYPLLTSDRKGVVYLRGTMTADKGLKFYPDTVSILVLSAEKERTLRMSFERN